VVDFLDDAPQHCGLDLVPLQDFSDFVDFDLGHG
jgi:hypothetical protein